MTTTTSKTCGPSVVRTRDAGAFLVESLTLAGDTATLTGSRRLWYWSGAASLSDLALNGVSRPNACKFPPAIPGDHVVLGVVEVIPATNKAVASVNAVPDWTEHGV